MSDLRKIPITEDQRDIMLHALGYNGKEPKLTCWRNYFMSDETPDLKYLCEHGFMKLASKGNQVHPDNYYVVTPDAQAMLCEDINVEVKAYAVSNKFLYPDTWVLRYAKSASKAKSQAADVLTDCGLSYWEAFSGARCKRMPHLDKMDYISGSCTVDIATGIVGSRG
jgi:hypothetical protein